MSKRRSDNNSNMQHGAAVIVTNTLGVIAYLLNLVACVLPVSVIAMLIMQFASTGERAVEPVNETSSALSSASGLEAIVYTAIGLVTVGLIFGAMIWFFLRVPPAVLRFVSRYVASMARILHPKPSLATILIVKSMLGAAPGAVMLLLYAFLWEYSVMLPLLAVTGLITGASLALFLLQSGVAKLLRVKPEELF